MSFSDRISALPTKQLFLIDGSGALTSTVFLGIVLPQYQQLVGMPLKVLYLLALLAMLFAVYSFTCYVVQANKKFLKAIAVINMGYCLLTAVLMIRYLNALTMLGLAYFVIELLIIVALVKVEWRHVAN